MRAGVPAISDGTLVIRGARIEAVGPSSLVKPPEGASRIDCRGGTLLPAFWNSHVHFLEGKWTDAKDLPADRLSGQLEAMLSRYGFAHVVDTGSDLGNTLALRDRIRSGKVSGPDIIASGMPFVAPGGAPFYAAGLKFPELRDPREARRAVRQAARSGAKAIKLMTVSLTREQPFPSMPLPTVAAAAQEAHRAGLKLLVHPTNRLGVELAVDGGADILLHTAPIDGPWEPEFAQKIVRAGVALVPTLKLWEFEAAKENDPALAGKLAGVARQQLAEFRRAGGLVLFGTDVGYMTDYDPGDEYVQMAASGMSPDDILGALTASPARVFAHERQGQLARGYDADLVLVDDDPFRNIQAFTDVRLTYRAGQKIYERRSD